MIGELGHGKDGDEVESEVGTKDRSKLSGGLQQAMEVRVPEEAMIYMGLREAS